MTETRVRTIECPWCKHVVAHERVCDNCGNQLPKGLQEMIYAQMVALTNRVESLFRSRQHQTEAEPIPIEMGEQAQEVQDVLRKKKGVTPVDRLASPDMRILKWVTNGTGEVQEIFGSEHTRRSVTILNLGQPAIVAVPAQGIPGQPAIAASPAFLSDNTTLGDSLFLPANGTLSLDYAGKMYVTDMAIAVTVLYIVSLSVR